MNKFKFGMLSVVSAVGAVAAFGLSAQPKTIADGVYTEEQAAAGQPIFEERCSACHNADFYKTALSNRNNQPLVFLFEEILGTMPMDMPGSLMDEDYQNVLAHILQITGFPAGEEPLDYYGGSMETVVIIPPES
mgnify:CR=1 FL=1